MYMAAKTCQDNAKAWQSEDLGQAPHLPPLEIALWPTYLTPGAHSVHVAFRTYPR